MSKKEFNSLADWKVGWWRKGKVYRYCYGIMWTDAFPMVKYRTQKGHLSNSRKASAVNPAFDEWFPKAEYLGTELPEEIKKSDSTGK